MIRETGIKMSGGAQILIALMGFLRPRSQQVRADAPNGAIAVDGRAPAVILVHGSGGSAEGMAWIAPGLAARGAIVVAADHPASAQGDPERRSILDMWEQPRDVSWMLDQLLRPEFAGVVDPGRVSVVGFSLGGASAMLLAGARLEMDRFRMFCETHDDGACRAFRRHFGSMDAAYLARAGQSHADVRVKAAVAIAPAFTEAMTSASLRSLGAPVLVIYAELDQQLPPGTHIRPVLEHLRPPSASHEVSGAQHFSFLPLCSPGAIAILAESNEEFACREARDKTRQQIHAETLGAMERFLERHGLLAGASAHLERTDCRRATSRSSLRAPSDSSGLTRPPW
jgi:predicted dienelactone hydrolase